jgi:SAM-dependent methyltransferase
MDGFWEDAFQSKQMMWGEGPTAAAIDVCDLFSRLGYKKVLIPGFGYGRNAKPFYDRGFEVTGIEISGTAIKLAQERFGPQIKVFHGAVGDMPFDQDIYDGVFCHALIHLLDEHERGKLIADCNSQLRPGGTMVFTAITKQASTYGVGETLGKDRFRTKDGVALFFYDLESIQREFGTFGLVEAVEIEETGQGKAVTKFWKIVCRK